MTKSSLIVLLGYFLASAAWPQESPPEREPDAAEVVEPAVAGEVEEIDDSDLDEQTYDEDDDDFIPSEEIPADEPIPFPSNI
jgi:hypothetical protein